MSIRIIIADDHKMFVDGLEALLREQRGVATEVVAVVGDGLQAIAAVEKYRPDLVIMDLSMPGMNGIVATQRITQTHPGIKVLCLSMHQDRVFVLAALRAGAAGYLLKECALEELTSAIRRVDAGDTYLSPGVAGMVVDALRKPEPDRESETPELLSTRELEVLQLMAEGSTTQDIADRLSISAKTVSTHREHIMAKLGIHSVAGLTKYAVRHGLTSLES